MKTAVMMKTIFFVILSYLPLLTFANSESDAETKHLAHSDQFASADVAPSSESSALSNSVELKIVSLAPHLTEWAFSLGLGPNLVGAVKIIFVIKQNTTCLPGFSIGTMLKASSSHNCKKKESYRLLPLP